MSYISLSQLLCEARIRLGDILSPEQFHIIWQAAINDEQDDPEAMDIGIKALGGKKNYINFTNWINAAYYTGLKEEDVLKQFQNMPEERARRILGSGGFGAVLSYGSDKIIKWFFGLDDQSERRTTDRFMAYCMSPQGKNDPFVPKIYKYVSGKYCVMERLITDDPRINKFIMICGLSWGKTDAQQVKFNFISKSGQIKKLTIANAAKDPDLTPEHAFTPEYQKAYEWCKHFALGEMGKLTGWVGDCREANVGIRPGSNEFVWFDI